LYRYTEESTHALSNLFGDEGVISVTKSFVVQVFRKAPAGSDRACHSAESAGLEDL
jgi:hypothetical protein